MSIKETLDEAKKEFSSDEQMLANAFKLEKFYKKHKIEIFSIIALGVIFFSTRGVMSFLEEQRLEAGNEAYHVLQNDEKNAEALATLKDENPALFELYSYKQAVKNGDTEVLKALSSNSNALISDMSAYHLSVIEKKEVTSELYKEMALVNNADILIKGGRVSEAKNQLDLIPEQSPVYNISTIIKHYSIKGK